MHSRTVTSTHLEQRVGNQAKRLKDTLILGMEMAEEFLDVWELHEGDAADVARQVFATGDPSDDQIEMVNDWRVALEEFQRLYDAMNSKVLKRVS